MDVIATGLEKLSLRCRQILSELPRFNRVCIDMLRGFCDRQRRDMNLTVGQPVFNYSLIDQFTFQYSVKPLPAIGYRQLPSTHYYYCYPNTGLFRDQTFRR